MWNNLVGSCLIGLALVMMSHMLVADEPIGNADDFFLAVEWQGVTSKPPFQAAFATANHEATLRKWQEERHSHKEYLPIAVVTRTESESLWAALSKFDVVVRVGIPPLSVSGNGWVISISSGSHQYYVDLGASEETARVFAQLREGLAESHREPMDRVIGSLRDRIKRKPLADDIVIPRK